MKTIEIDCEEVVKGAEIAAKMGKTHMVAWNGNTRAAGYAAWIFKLPDLERVENNMRIDWLKRQGIMRDKTVNLRTVWRLGREVLKATKQ